MARFKLIYIDDRDEAPVVASTMDDGPPQIQDGTGTIAERDENRLPVASAPPPIAGEAGRVSDDINQSHPVVAGPPDISGLSEGRVIIGSSEDPGDSGPPPVV